MYLNAFVELVLLLFGFVDGIVLMFVYHCVLLLTACFFTLVVIELVGALHGNWLGIDHHLLLVFIGIVFHRCCYFSQILILVVLCLLNISLDILDVLVCFHTLVKFI